MHGDKFHQNALLSYYLVALNKTTRSYYLMLVTFGRIANVFQNESLQHRNRFLEKSFTEIGSETM